MNKTAVLCLLMACLALGQSMYMPNRFCRDYMGRRILPGQRFYIDRCNTCLCSRFGQPTMCTMMKCPPIKPILPPIKPILPPVNPILPKKPVFPGAY